MKLFTLIHGTLDSSKNDLLNIKTLKWYKAAGGHLSLQKTGYLKERGGCFYLWQRVVMPHIEIKHEHYLVELE